MGVVIFYGGVIVLLNFIVDMLYAWLNPKIRFDEG
jgi:oligopeptide transport system permease protein